MAQIEHWVQYGLRNNVAYMFVLFFMQKYILYTVQEPVQPILQENNELIQEPVVLVEIEIPLGFVLTHNPLHQDTGWDGPGLEAQWHHQSVSEMKINELKLTDEPFVVQVQYVP